MDIVRFAPSPTGYLHIGGVRTALFNYLHAKSTGGKFLLRIEDTDLNRNQKESYDAIINGLTKLGLQWDGDIIYQSNRLDVYKAMVTKLIANGLAYHCYHTKEELEAFGNRTNKSDKFLSMWRDIKPNEYPADKPYVVRLKVERGKTLKYVDRIFGELSFNTNDLNDEVIMRSDGTPLYNFAAVVDDNEFGVNLVIRGSDHIINTPFQILLYNALGFTVPSFAHLPMIMGPDGQKLSKRNSYDIPVTLEDYFAEGYDSLSILNYLVRFGWSYKDQEIFTMEDMISKFNIDKIHRSNGIFDKVKFEAINHKIIKDNDMISLGNYKNKLKDYSYTSYDDKHINVIREQSKTYKMAIESLKYISNVSSFKYTEIENTYYKDICNILNDLPNNFTHIDVTTVIKSYCKDKDFKFKDVCLYLNKVLTGKESAPPFAILIEVLGKDDVLLKLNMSFINSKIM